MSNLRINPLDIPLTPFEVELLNPNPTAGRRKDAPVYRTSFEMERDPFQAFMDARHGNLRILAVMLVLPDIEDERTEQAKDAALRQLQDSAQRILAQAKQEELETASNTKPDVAKRPPPEKREKKAAKPKEERPPDQRINGMAWSYLLRKSKDGNGRGFARCAGVWEKINDKPGEDNHEKMRSFFRVPHLSVISLQTALSNFTHPNAKTMLRQAWDDARKEIEAKAAEVAEPQIEQPEEAPLVSEEEIPF